VRTSRDATPLTSSNTYWLVRLGVRYVYNWALRLRSDAYYQEQRRVSYHDASAELTHLKQQPETIWLNEVSSVPPQQALRHLDKAFRNFFEGRANYPAFKKKHSIQSAEYTTSAFKWDGASLTLAKMEEPLAIRWSRPLPDGCKPSTVTVCKDCAGRYAREHPARRGHLALARDSQDGWH
jgi:putative transposase